MKPMLIDENGHFAGYASLFHSADQSGDRVMPGAFAASLARRNAKGVRMLFQHDPREPVGAWARLAEDDRGLFAEGRLIADGGRADTLKRLIGGGALDGLSIGFRTVRADKQGAGRRLWEIDLWEVSIVTFPMHAGARISARSHSDPDHLHLLAAGARRAIAALAA
ncbi:HK97 family phage prohead protease [Cucumibacter marinus]|uniref:HK97 family phage prohead protease n=1 Tax=Cucumibacter marinus TaxID=1121252 RepID=UPI001FDF27C3|nr:HK97 family phage prohead protease [Cucumibacter marinus]